MMDDNWPAVINNIQKAWKIWDHLSSILGWEVEDSRIPGHFYLPIVQASLIFGADTWVLPPCIGGGVSWGGGLPMGGTTYFGGVTTATI